MVDKDIIARRVFDVDEREVECRILRPVEEDGSFFCSYEIDWPEGTRAKKVGGIDDLQALFLAMQLAHVDLLVARADGRAIGWLDDTNLGLPLMDGVFD